MAAIVAVATSAKPQANPTETIDVVCHDLTLNTDFIGLFGMVYIFANNEEYELTGAIFADSIPPGRYTNCVMDLTHIATNEKIPAQENGVELFLAVDKNRNCAITGTMLGKDNILYNLDLSWHVPGVMDSVAISFENSSEVAYYPDLGHDFRLTNQNADYEVSLDIAGVQLGETFTEKNVVDCFIVNKAKQDTVRMGAADGQIWQSNDTTYLTATVIGFDSTSYSIELWYAVPTISKTVTLNLHNAKFHNYLERDGYYSLVATNEDKSLEFAISLLGDTEEDIPGKYVNDGLFGGFTGKDYDFLNYITGQYATYIATDWNAEKEEYDKIFTIEKGNATITMDKDSTITMVGSFISNNGIKYDITLTTKVDKPRYQFDMTSGSVECIITGDDITLEDKTTEDGSIFFDIMTDKELLALMFYAEEADPEIVIPEGTYQIDNSSDYYTAQASDGSISSYPSMYATHNRQDFTSMYFFVCGTVVVTNENGLLHMDIHALNSYDVPAHIEVRATISTNTENIHTPDKVSATKKLIKGQLIISRNGETYSILGAKIK
jgi:hypothetical protein